MPGYGDGAPSDRLLDMVKRSGRYGAFSEHSVSLPIILTNKVRAPAGASAASLRPRLVPPLQELESSRLVLLKAPAGYGKTTLLRQYYDFLSDHDFAVAWLRFDAAENEKTRAVAYIAAAFAEIDPGLNADLAPIFSALPPLPVEDILAALLNRLESINRHIFFLVDDYHTIHDAEVHKAFFYFLVNMPHNVHCVVASRSLPPWTLSEISHGGAVRVFEDTEIRFNPEEIAEYLKEKHGVILDDAGLKALYRQTEGWITAVKLASLSLEKQHSGLLPDKVITGTHRGLVNYLAGTVFERQDRETQEFLLQTAPLDRFCSSLCDAVTGSNNARAMLDKLLRENLFLEPLDAQGEWYRYHSLFAEFLIDRLEKHPRLKRADIHRKASFWFEVNRQPYAAAEHAMAGGAEARKEALIEAAILSMVRASQISLAIGWFESLPKAFSENKPNVLIPMAWSYFVARRMKKAQELLAQARSLLTQRPEQLSEEDKAHLDEFLVETEIAELDIKRTQLGEVPDIKILKAIKERLSPEWHFLRAYVELQMCHANIQEDKLDAAFAAASDSVIFAKKVPNAFIANLALEQLAQIRFLQGRLDEARQYCSQAIDRALDDIGAPLPVASHFHLLFAKIYYESNDLQKSHAHLDEAMRLTALNESPDVLCETEILAAKHIAVSHGEHAAANRLIEYNNRQLDLSMPQSIDRVRSYQAWFLTGCGDLDAAEGILKQISAPTGRAAPPPTLTINPLLEIRYLALCRYLIASQKAEQAVNWLRYLLRQAQQGRRTQSCIAIHGLLALVQIQRDQPDNALRNVREMLMLGEQGGFARTIVDLGDDLVALIDDYQKRLSRSEEASGHEERLQYVRHLLNVAKGSVAPITAAKSTARKSMAEPLQGEGSYDRLTSRELQILELIAAGKRNREVASELLIAESSVRWHVRNLYAKLEAHNRTEASAKARALKLIH